MTKRCQMEVCGVEEMVVIGVICVFIGFESFVSKPSLSLIIK